MRSAQPDPALQDWRKDNPQHPVLRDADAKWYVREERGGWILGPYERNAPAWAVHGVPEGFRADLLPLDLERIEEEYASFIHRIPSSEHCGLKDDFNGPICYTPDGNPLIGPAPGVQNFWYAEGFSFGITAAGGAGYYLAQLMSEGEAEIDMYSLDPRRFGPWMNRSYAAKKNEEAYEHVYILHHPDEERPACRPLKTAPCYDRLKAGGSARTILPRPGSMTMTRAPSGAAVGGSMPSAKPKPCAAGSGCLTRRPSPSTAFLGRAQRAFSIG